MPVIRDPTALMNPGRLGAAVVPARRAFPQLLDQRLEDDAETVDVRPDPAGPVHDRDPPQRAVPGGVHACDLKDRLLDGAGEVA